MSARTHSTACKIRAGDNCFLWRLEFVTTRNIEPLRLQNWRIVGDGRTPKEQIREYAISLHGLGAEDIEDTVFPGSGSKGSLSSDNLTTTEVISVRSQSQSTTHSLFEEGEIRPRSPSPSVGSEFVHAECPRESKEAIDPIEGAKSMAQGESKEEGEIRARSPSPSVGSDFIHAEGPREPKEAIDPIDGSKLMGQSESKEVMDSHNFKIFRVDDGGRREPAPITDLEFECEGARAPTETLTGTLRMVAQKNVESSEEFAVTIDTWTMMQDGEGRLGLCVRSTNLSWTKLCNPSKGFETSIHDALIISRFLELAMSLKTSNSTLYIEKLLFETRSDEDEVKGVLLKYYDSVVKRFVQFQKVPVSLRNAPIIQDMEILLKRNVEEDPSPANVSGMKRKCTSELHSTSRPDEEDQELLQKRAATLVSIKRKRVVESDSENESDAEDYVPLSQRNFAFIQRQAASESVLLDEGTGITPSSNTTDQEMGRRKKDPRASDGRLLSPSSAGRPISAASGKDDGSSRWVKEDMTCEEDPAFQDIDDIYGGQNDDLEDEDSHQDLGESALCAICDDGGDLLFCDGECMRSFHASEAASKLSESQCISLGYTTEEVKEMGSWLCPNCVQKKHQCFACGRLGSSAGNNQQVFSCDVALCGRFYHPDCVVKWKAKEGPVGLAERDAIIASVQNESEEFCCPAHKCRKCGEGEKEGGQDNSKKLAKCRRCPKTYHKSCLPKNISFEARGDKPIRAWEIGEDEDPVKRIVIYCTAHDIDEELSTPERNHLKWPEGDFYSLSLSNVKKLQTTQKHTKSWAGKPFKEKAAELGDAEDVNSLFPTRPKMSSKVSTAQAGRANNQHADLRVSTAKWKDASASTSMKHSRPSKEREFCEKQLEKDVFEKEEPVFTEEEESRVTGYLRQAAEKITIESVKKELKQPRCYGENKKKVIIHRGEIISILNAVKKAHEKVKAGGSVEDAKNLCPRDSFIKLLRTEETLKVHLAPILHGTRYTSFGRHFTRIDKLKEICERIHPYVDDGDMVVDFCCGANDFSVLLKEKLVSVGKTCHYLNFDIHPPKNTFCFTKGDWLENTGRGFLEGKRLIMGLNPPFGVRAALANRFIIHALSFRPKLLVLIVPEETMSFSNDYKNYNYELVWEDRKLLAGHAFYLPGSVDSNDNENKSQWNVKPPPLYLWSSAETARKHKNIALEWKHVEDLQQDIPGMSHESPLPSPPAPPSNSSLPVADTPQNVCDAQDFVPSVTRVNTTGAQSGRFLGKRPSDSSPGHHHVHGQNAAFPGNGSRDSSPGHHPLYSQNAPFPGNGSTDSTSGHHPVHGQNSSNRIGMRPGAAGHGGPFRSGVTVHRGFPDVPLSDGHGEYVNLNLHQSMPDAIPGVRGRGGPWRSQNLHQSVPDVIPEAWGRTDHWRRSHPSDRNQDFHPASYPPPPDLPRFPSPYGLPPQQARNAHNFPQAWPRAEFVAPHPHVSPGLRHEGPRIGVPGQNAYRRGAPEFDPRSRGPGNDGTGGWLEH